MRGNVESSECVDFHAQCVMVGRYAHRDRGIARGGVEVLGQANKINCFSGIFLRKTHAGCGFFFFLQTTTQLVSDQKPQASHSRE